ncbi:MAG: hypothetical protein AB1428_05885, partial [Bacteroidota bacterium]
MKVFSANNELAVDVGTNVERFNNYAGSGVSYKHHDWNDVASDMHLTRTLSIQPNTPPQFANFVDLRAVRVQNTMLDLPSINSGSIWIRDPWWKDPQTGAQPDVLREFTSPVDSGVFLNQIPDPQNPNKPYYTVGALSPQTIGGFTSNFLNWRAHPDSASFLDSTAAQTGVVFKQSNAKVTAIYKANLGSNLSSATGLTTQRRMICTYGSSFAGYSVIYESQHEIWWTHSSDGVTWSPEMRLSRGSGKARNPSISEVAFGSSPAAYAVWVDTTNRSGASGFDVNVRRLDLNTGAWGETEYLVHPDYPSGAGFARSDAKPVAV